MEGSVTFLVERRPGRSQGSEVHLMPLSQDDAKKHAVKFLGLMMTNPQVLKAVQDIPLEAEPATGKQVKDSVALGKVMQQHLATGELAREDVKAIARNIHAETTRLSGLVRGHAPEVADALECLTPPMTNG